MCTALALAEVNACLRRQGRPDLKVTESALLRQLRDDGRLVDASGQPLGADATVTHRVRLDGSRQKWVFTVSRRALIGDDAPEPAGAGLFAG